MEWIKLIIICVLLGRAIYTDMKYGMIENRCIGLGLLSGLLLVYVEYGLEGLAESIKTMGVVLLVFFSLFLIKGLGAGDIKLFCVLAVCYPEYIVGIVMMSFLVAAGWSIGKMLLRIVRKQTVYIRGETLNFSIPIACGVFLVFLYHLIPSFTIN